jgi:SAM-dependent methyltransferase
MKEEEDDPEYSYTPYASISVVKKYLKQKDNLSVVDLGCGSGYFLFGLKDDPDLKFDLMEGVDHWKGKTMNLDSNYHIDIGYKNNKYPEIKSYEDDVFSFISRATISYDLIIASNLIHFFEKQEIEALINRCYALLKPGGVMYIKMINSDHPHSDDYKTIYSDELVVDIMKICPVRYVSSTGKHGEIVIVN